MAEVLPTEEDIYQRILDALRSLGAQELAQQIERTVARGAVAPGEVDAVGRKKPEKIKFVAAMSGRESLPIALEFLVAASEVPLMVNHVRQALACNAVEWKPDEPGPRAEDMNVLPIPPAVDLSELKLRIDSLVTVMHELKLDHPEIV